MANSSVLKDNTAAEAVAEVVVLGLNYNPADYKWSSGNTGINNGRPQEDPLFEVRAPAGNSIIRLVILLTRLFFCPLSRRSSTISKKILYGNNLNTERVWGRVKT